MLNWMTGGTLEANCPDCEVAQTPEAAPGAMRQMARGVSPLDSCGEPAAQARVGQALGLYAVLLERRLIMVQSTVTSPLPKMAFAPPRR